MNSHNLLLDNVLILLTEIIDVGHLVRTLRLTILLLDGKLK